MTQTRQALRLNQERYRALSENATDLVAIAGRDGRYSYASPSFQSVLGYAPDDVVGSPITVHFDVESRALFERHWAAWQQPGAKPTRLDLQAQHADGTWRWFEAIVQPVLDDPAIGGIMAIARDVTERKHMEEELRHQTLHDALTGLPNRTLLQNHLEQSLSEAGRHESKLALLLLDLDRFNEVNDTFGHSHGDLVLQEVARRLVEASRPGDFVARLGGDEFAVVCARDDAAGALAAADTLQNTLSDPIDVDGYVLHLNARIGIALYPDHGIDAAALLRCADVAKYVAAQDGQPVAVYSPERDPHSAERLMLIADLRQAIAHGAFVLHYQPKIDLTSDEICGVEVLARWPHQTLGMIGPDRFIGMAEQTGQIDALTRWVLEEAVRQVHAWLVQGITMPIAVNLSAANLLDLQLQSVIMGLLAKYEVPPALLRLEMTESTLMANTEQALDVLTHLSALGIGLSIDDYGTGYSSLAYIKRLPVDEIKIDRSFVQHLADDESDAVIVASTVGLAHSLGRRVVAEGVETERALRLLREFQCDVVQGYYLSRPLPAEGIERWMRERSALCADKPSAA